MNTLFTVYVYITNWFKAEEGQDLIEYALITGFIALAAVAALTATGTSVNALWTAVQTAVAAAAAT